MKKLWTVLEMTLLGELCALSPFLQFLVLKDGPKKLGAKLASSLSNVCQDLS